MPTRFLRRERSSAIWALMGAAGLALGSGIGTAASAQIGPFYDEVPVSPVSGVLFENIPGRFRAGMGVEYYGRIFSNTFLTPDGESKGLSVPGCCVGDFDGDGNANCYGDGYGYGYGDGYGYGYPIEERGAGGGVLVNTVSADMNGDGLDDLVSLSSSMFCSSVAIYWNTDGDDAFDNYTQLAKTDTGWPFSSFFIGVTAFAVGDIDGDGDNDLVVGGASVSYDYGYGYGYGYGGYGYGYGYGYFSGYPFLSVYLNTGGSFNEAETLTPTEIPTTIALGDLDDDGDLDVVTGRRTGLSPIAEYSTTRLQVHQTDMSGTFSLDTLPSIPGQDLHVGAIGFGDFDGDGDTDLALTRSDGGPFSVTDELVWLEQTGASPLTFAEGGTIADGLPATYAGDLDYARRHIDDLLRVGDFDQDGDVDVLHSGDGRLTQFLQTGPGASAWSDQVLVESRAYSPTLYDVDLDAGFPDDIVLSYGSVLKPGKVSVQGQPNAFFSFASALDAVPGFVTITSDPVVLVNESVIDLRGRPSLVFSSEADFERPAGTTTRAGPTTVLLPQKGGLSIVGGTLDVPDDGMLSFGSEPALLTPTSQLTLGERARVQISDSMLLGSVLTGAGSAIESMGDLELVGTPGFLETTTPGSLPATQAVFALDLDLDGTRDLVTLSGSTAGLAWHRVWVDAQRRFALDEPAVLADIPSGSNVPPVLADFDGDGDPDAAHHVSGSGVRWLEIQPGPTPEANARTGSVFGWQPMYEPIDVIAVDLTGSGQDDLVVFAQDTNSEDTWRLLWLSNLGGPEPAFATNSIEIFDTSDVEIHAADIDGDGDTDLVLASTADNQIRVRALLNSGQMSPTFGQEVAIGTFQAPSDSGVQRLAVADVAGGPLPDLIVQDASGLRVLTNALPGGGFQSGAALGADPADRFGAIDLDGNGTTDLYTEGDTGFSWYSSNGLESPSYENNFLTPSAIRTGQFVVDDLDHDQRPDVVWRRTGNSRGLTALRGVRTDGITLAESGAAIAVNGELGVENATLELGPTNRVRAGAGLTLRSAGRLLGDGLVDASLASAGVVAPSGSVPLTVTGDYVQSADTLSAGTRSGLLETEIDADPSTEMLVQGRASLAGNLIVRLSQPDEIPDTFETTVLRAEQGLDGLFDTVFVTPALPNNRFITVSYGTDTRGAGGSVVLGVGTLSEPIDYGDPNGFAAGGTPSAATLGDLNGDDFPDLAVTVPDALNPTSAPGQLVVLINDGTGGFATQVSVPTGVNPRGVAIGDLDGSGGLDLAVSNTGGDSVSLYANSGTALPAITLDQTLLTGIGSAPRDLAIRQFDGLPGHDIAVALSGSSSLRFYGALGGGAYADSDVPTELDPTDIDPFDDDKDDIYSLAVAHGSPSMPGVSVLANDGGGGFSAGFTPTADVPTEIRAAELSGDAFVEVVTANATGDSVTVLVGNGVGSVASPSTLPVESNPTSLTVLDADDDGDLDLALTADGEAGRIVQIIRNDTQTTGQLLLSAAEQLNAGGEAVLVRSADVDQDGRDDLVTVNDESGVLRLRGGGAEDVAVLLSASAGCPGDVTSTAGTQGVPDGQTNLSDLRYFIGIWQEGLASAVGSPADVNTTGAGNGLPDGEVNLSDLQFFLTQWQTGLGLCP